MRRILHLMILLAVAAGAPAAAEPAAGSPVVTLRATVTGNQEQPRVMYILPWQPSETGEFEYSPAPSLAEDLFRGLDREEFVRELSYRDALGSRQALGSRDALGSREAQGSAHIQPKTQVNPEE